MWLLNGNFGGVDKPLKSVLLTVLTSTASAGKGIIVEGISIQLKQTSALTRRKRIDKEATIVIPNK